MLGSLIPWRTRSLFPASDRFTRFEEEMQEMMSRFFPGEEGWMKPMAGFTPKLDLVESEGAFEVTVDLPGMKPEEVNVELKNGQLWITGEMKEEKEEEGKTYHRVERHYGEFRRILPLPTAVKEDEIEAKFTEGVLKITVPKSEEAKAKHIEVKT